MGAFQAPRPNVGLHPSLGTGIVLGSNVRTSVPVVRGRTATVVVVSAPKELVFLICLPYGAADRNNNRRDLFVRRDNL